MLKARENRAVRAQERDSDYDRYPRRDSGGSFPVSGFELDSSPIGHVKHVGCPDCLIWRYELGQGGTDCCSTVQG